MLQLVDKFLGIFLSLSKEVLCGISKQLMTASFNAFFNLPHLVFVSFSAIRSRQFKMCFYIRINQTSHPPYLAHATDLLVVKI
jgi:hypothetical protein